MSVVPWPATPGSRAAPRDPEARPQAAAVLRGHAAPPQALAFSPDERFLYSGDASGELRCWDLESCRPTFANRLPGHEEGILWLAAIPADEGQTSGATGRSAATRSGGESRWILLTQGRGGVHAAWRCHPETGQPCRLSLWSRTETSFTFCRDSALALDAPHPAAPSALLAISAREGRAVLVGTLCQPTRSEEEVDPDATWTYDARFIVDRMLVEEAERDRGIDRRADEARKGEGEEGGREGGGAEAGGARGDATACALFRAPSGAPLLLVGWDGGLVDLFDLPGLEAAGEGSEEGKGQTSSTPPSVALSGLSLEPRTTASSAPHPRRLLDPLSTLRVQAKAPVLALAAAGATCAAVGASSRGALFDLGRPKKKKEKTGGAGEREGSGKGVEDEAGEREPLVAVAPASARRVAASAPPPVFSLRHPRPFRLPREGANDVALRRDGRVAVAACWDGVVRAVDAETGETVGKLKRHADQVAAVRYSPSGRLLATAGGEGGIALWIAARGAEKVRLFLGAS